jgi:anaerobic selenocysteine-containing dehydrogenase
MTQTNRMRTRSSSVPAQAGTEVKKAVCTVCDIACQLDVHVRDGEVTKVAPPSNPVFADFYCLKGISAAKLYGRPERLKQPLRRVGERGSGKWEPVPLDEAMGEIAKRLQTVIDRYGPEAFAVSTSNWNTSVECGMGRRVFMQRNDRTMHPSYALVSVTSSVICVA